MSTATLTSKGQITIPKDVRKELGVHQGDRFEFVVESDRTLRLRLLRRSVRELAGILRRPGQKPVSVEEMGEAIAEWHAAEDAQVRDRC